MTTTEKDDGIVIADETETTSNTSDNEEDEEGMFPTLEDFLVTSDGENIADGIVHALDRISKQLDAQNKIFIKLYTVLSKTVLKN